MYVQIEILKIIFRGSHKPTRKTVCDENVNNLIDSSPPEGCLQLSNSVTRGHPLRFTQLQTNVDSYKYSFYPYTITLWNSLPNTVVTSTSLESFKMKLNI